MKRLIVVWLVWTVAVVVFLACLALGATAGAQTVRADRFTFNTGPCVMRSGSGSPEGVVVGRVCDRWHRTDSPFYVYTKTSGTGNTGWTLLASTDLTDSANLARLNAATNAFTSAMTIGTTLGVTGLLTASSTVFAPNGDLIVGNGLGSAQLSLNSVSGASDGPRVYFEVAGAQQAEIRYNAGSSLFTLRNTSSKGITLAQGAVPVVTVEGALAVDSTLGVTGISTLTGALAANGGLSVDSPAFTVADTTGNVATTGTLAVTGVSTLTGLANANGGIAVDTTNFTVSGTTGAVSTASSITGTSVAATATVNPYLRISATGVPYLWDLLVPSNGRLGFYGNGATEYMTLLSGGNVGIGTPVPTAVLHLKAGTTTANTAPIKLTSGSLLTAAEAGAVEFLTDKFYGTITTGAARKTFAFLESPVLVTPTIGVAIGTSLAASGAITSSSATAGIGYTTGAGGAQTQATSKATTVVSNTITTAITMNAAALAAGAIVSFTFTNSTIAALDQVICTHQSAGTNGAYLVNARPAAGSASIAVRNTTAGSLSEAIVLRCSVYKAVSS